jgi:uracil-DNA glycosylase family 4
MSLDLDERQRAMLQEIGVRVFAPHVDSFARAAQDDGTPPEPPRQAGGRADLRPASPESAPVVPHPQAPLPRTPIAEAPLRPAAGGVAGMEWEALAQAVAECRACGLCEGRTQAVFGVGDLQADWMVIGEAPGEEEDQQGEPFLGEHGKLLDNMLAAVGVRRDKGAYIANLLKCRPPPNRNPSPQEIAQCEPFLRRQVELLQPKVILAMGRFAVETLLQTNEPVGKLRGRVHRYHGVPLVVTYHPAYLLRKLPEKAKAWADLCLAQEVMRGRA